MLKPSPSIPALRRDRPPTPNFGGEVMFPTDQFPQNWGLGGENSSKFPLDILSCQ